MHPQGVLTYCPKCGKEVYPASEPCNNCKYPNVKVILTPKQLDDLLSNRISKMIEVIEYIRQNVIAVED